MNLKIDYLQAVDMGSDQQEIADWVLDQVSDITFQSKDEFDEKEGQWIGEACKALGWHFTPQTGGFEVNWVYPIKIGGAQTSVSEEEMDKIISDLGISENDWAHLPSSSLIDLIAEKSDGHYTF
tara:strand:+ start:509 stop:880 length:372 start_codon:yes stop_codon:yes gene_type:complete